MKLAVEVLSLCEHKMHVEYIGWQRDADNTYKNGFAMVNDPSGSTIAFKPNKHRITKNYDQYKKDADKISKELNGE